MDGDQKRVNSSLRRRLSRALFASIVGVALLAGAFSFAAAYDEARELQDDMLRQVAQLVARVPLPQHLPLADSHPFRYSDDARVIVQRLGQSNPARRSVDAGGALAVPETLGDGLHTLILGGESFRVLVGPGFDGDRIVVAQESDLRDNLALSAALRTLLPFLILVPVLLLIVARLIPSALSPIDRLARELDRRREDDLEPMPTSEVPAELAPFVTAINRVLKRIAEAMDDQRRFVADAAHELRSPFAALTLQAERLAAVALPQAAVERLAPLRQGIARGSRLVEQLLALARIQSAGNHADTPVSVQRIFRQVLENLMPLAQSRHIDAGVSSAQDVLARASERDLYTLVRNLVDNAIRYSPVGGRVDLSVDALDGQAVLTVRDHGPGIPPEERDRVFDPFYRVLGTDQTGSGLGLSIVLSVARRIGASIRLGCTNDAGHSGLTVVVSIPAAAGPRTA